jgi:serine/tyrosine/threonine adenylyltransferase
VSQHGKPIKALKNRPISRMRDNSAMLNPPLVAPDAALHLAWTSSFAALGEDFYTTLSPTPLPNPYWVGRSPDAAALLGLLPDALEADAALALWTGNLVATGTQPLASVYSGHQFGVWAGQLGDGRAILLGEIAGQEVQLKGAGMTPYSRMGDGRAVLRSSIREFLASEAMHGLGIPTSRALCVTGSDAPVRRETVETAAVVTRLAPSFIRFGHFEHFCHHNLHPQLRQLADFVIDHHYPSCRTDVRFGGNPYASLLAEVTERTAELMALWQSVGFCHGVMNTDNMSILGLTIDYGPFQFLDHYDPDHICNHSDNQGRYAFKQQPQVAYWNLFCLGQALMPLIEDSDLAIAALERYKTLYADAFARRMAAKLGLPESSEVQVALVERLMQLLATDAVDYSIFWRRLAHWAQTQSPDDHSVRDLFVNRNAADAWLLSYSELLAQYPRGLEVDLMLKINPKYVLRNHLGELAIAASKAKDFSVVNDLLQVLLHPYDEHPDHAEWSDFAPDWARQISISCSS